MTLGTPQRFYVYTFVSSIITWHGPCAWHAASIQHIVSFVPGAKVERALSSGMEIMVYPSLYYMHDNHFSDGWHIWLMSLIDTPGWCHRWVSRFLSVPLIFFLECNMMRLKRTCIHAPQSIRQIGPFIMKWGSKIWGPGPQWWFSLPMTEVAQFTSCTIIICWSGNESLQTRFSSTQKLISSFDMRGIYEGPWHLYGRFWPLIIFCCWCICYFHHFTHTFSCTLIWILLILQVYMVIRVCT